MAAVKDLARPQSIVDRQVTASGDSWKRVVAITPSNTTVYSPRLQAITAGGAGTLEIINSNGDQVTYTVVAGQTVLDEIKQVLAASTATELVGMS